jgi:hypothetical protein
LSSILKALKKLESQATDQNHVRIRRPKSNMQHDDHEQINGRPHFKKGYVIIFAGLVFAAGAGFILSNKFYEKKSTSITKKEAIVEKPARFFEKKAVIQDKKAISREPVRLHGKMAAIPDKKVISQKSVRLPGKKTVMPDKNVMPQKSVRLPEKMTAIPDNAQKTMASRKHVKKSETIAKVAKAAPTSAHESRGNNRVLYNKKTSPLKQTQKKAVVEKTSEKSSQNREDDRFSSMPVKRSNQTNIEVQAIAWANDPKNRLAVINGLILREGESIDNIIVMHIGKDAVVFRKGAEGWKQMFGF